MYTTNRTFTAPPKATSDTSAYGVSDDETITYCTFIGAEGSEALKLSRNVTKADISTSTFSGGVEDCIDILGADNVTFTNCIFLRGNAVRDCTIKGGASYIKFFNCIGLKYIKAGDCTIYEKKGLGPAVNNCYIQNPQGKKTIVLCLNSEPFKGDVINIRIPKIFVKLYFWARWKFFK